MGRQRPWRKAIAAVGVLGVAVVMATPASAQTASGSISEPIVEGLIGPLGLDLGINGTIYVAESFAGRLVRFNANGGARTVLYESQSASPNGVATNVGGRVLMTLTIFPEDPSGPPEDTSLVEVRPNGVTTTVASLLEHEVEDNPDAEQMYGFLNLPAGCEAKLPPPGPFGPGPRPYSGIVESNPYKVAVQSFSRFLVADAAGNSIVGVSRGGQTETLAILPPVPQRFTLAAARQFDLPFCTVGRTYTSEPVPTDVEIGPDGDYYVSSLPGFPELPGSASVFRIDAETRDVSLVATGFSGAVDLAVAADGTIYVAELFGNRISAISNGVVSTVVDVFSPGAVEIDNDGTLYATTGVFGPSGNVVIVTP